MFLGCGPSLTSTLVTMPTTVTVRPRFGTVRGVPSGATSGEPMSVETRSASLTPVAFACLASRAPGEDALVDRRRRRPGGRLLFLRLGAVHPLDRLCHSGLPSGASARLRDRCRD